jgi:superfamily II DNA or RNA helicase
LRATSAREDCVFTPKDIREQFGGGNFDRGRNYLRRGFVVNIVPRGDGLGCHASVRNESGKRYESEVRWHRDPRGHWQFESACTCPVGGSCKHVAAVLLRIAAGNQEHGQAEDGGNTPPPNGQPKPQTNGHAGGPNGAQANNGTRRQRGRNKMLVAQGQQNQSDRQANSALWQWLDRLRRITQPPTPTEPVDEQLLYLLNLDGEHQPVRRALVRVVSVRAKGDGSPGKPRVYNGDLNRPARFVSAEDQDILLELVKRQGSNQGPDRRLEGEWGARLLKRMIATGRVFWREPKGEALQEAPSKAGSLFWASTREGRYRLQVGVDDAPLILPVVPPWYIDVNADLAGPVALDVPANVLGELLLAPALPPDATERAVRELPGLIGPVAEQIAPPILVQERRVGRVRPRPVLRLLRTELKSETRGERVLDCAQILFDYRGIRCSFDEHQDPLVRTEGTEVIRIDRDRQAEQRAWQKLVGLGIFPTDYQRQSLLVPRSERDWIPLMLGPLPALADEGWLVEIDPDFAFRLHEPEPEWLVQLEDSSNDWFGLSLDITVDGQRMPLLPLLTTFLHDSGEEWTAQRFAALDDNEPFVLRDEENRRLIRVPAGRLKPIFATLLELFDSPLESDGQLRLPRHASAVLSDLAENQQLSFIGGERLRALAERMRNSQGVEEVEPPKGLKAELRPYQRQGLSWLQFLSSSELGGVLADDMGLGKTVQTLAHLLIEKESGRMDRPCLVVAPTSLMFNWKREAKRFAPSLKVLLLHGHDRKERFDAISRYDIVLTTYPLLPRDFEVLSEPEYHIVILDEAQNIKNSKSRAAQLVGQLKTRHRLCLTGTPMENHLGEFWSLMNFLMPGLFADETAFKRRYRTPIEKHGDQGVRNQLVKRAKPFLLRRTKAEVAKDLPPITHILRTVALEDSQRDLYEAVRIAMDEKVRAEIAAKGMGRSHIVVLDALLKLRQVCCDPRLVKLDSAAGVTESAKLDMLMELLPEMVEEGRRILLFSQFTSMLSLIEKRVEEAGIEYLKLTGSTKDREPLVERFQTGEVPLFLIRLKAGGVGLNLTAADTVIHYDPWWNPAVEQQATDRAHRIGQDKPVFVYKLLTEGTVEQKIAELQDKKRELADALLSESGGALAWTPDDLQDLFAPLT